MKSDDTVYLIYYNRPRNDMNGGLPRQDAGNYYGWTTNKLMLKMFLKSRKASKYYFEEMMYSDIEDGTYEMGRGSLKSYVDPDYQLCISKIQSMRHRIVSFITTAVEMSKAENMILSRLVQCTSLEEYEHMDEAIRVYQCLRREYQELLDFIGYIPKELRSIGGTLEELDNMHRSDFDVPWEEFTNDDIGQMLWSETLAKGLVYSFEAYVKVLREDLQ